MRVALDTNVLAYAEGLGDQSRCGRAMELVERLPLGEVIIPAQTLGELSRVLRSKAKRSAEDTRSVVLSWADTFSVADSTWSAFQAALDLNVDHKLQIWDALVQRQLEHVCCRQSHQSEEVAPCCADQGVFLSADAQPGCGEKADIPRFDEFIVLYSALFDQEIMCFADA